jgi:molecular chaperone HtpG
MRKEEWKEGEDGKPGEHVLTGRMGNRQPGHRAVEPVQEGHHARAVQEFYKAISHDYEDAAGLDATTAWKAAPSTRSCCTSRPAPIDLWNRDKSAGVKLYVKRVFIMDDAEALLPSVPALREGRDRLGRPAAERQPRAAAGKPRREGDPRRQHQAACWACWKTWRRREGRSGERAEDKADRRGASTPSSTPNSARAEGRPGRGLRQPRAPGQAAALRLHHQRHGERLAGRLQGAHEGRPGRHLLHHRRHAAAAKPTARSSRSSARRASRCCT